MSKKFNSQSANALRILALDSVKQANSGHSGMPMGMADIAAVLWQGHLSHNPRNPGWFNRDRFVLSRFYAHLWPCQRTAAISAMPIGIPEWPEFACLTESKARILNAFAD